MGLYDTMQQGLANNPAAPQAAPINGTSAQKQPAMEQNAWQQKQQMRANPMMKRPPVQGASFGQPNTSQTPNPMTGARPAMGMQPGMQGGSRDAMQLKMQQLKAQQAAASGTQMGSYNELAANNPQLQQNRQYGEKIGQDMSWMDKPGALQLPQGYGQAPPQRPQSGLQDVASRYAAEQNPQSTQIMGGQSVQDMNRTEPNAMEQQIMASKPNVQMGAVQNGGASGPMGTTMGQEDPRQQQYNTWLNGGGGENPYATPEPQAEVANQSPIGGSGIQNIMQRMNGGMQRSQLMPRRR